MASGLLKRHYAILVLLLTLRAIATDSVVTRVSSQSPTIKYGGGWANETTGRADKVSSQFMLSNYVATATYIFSGTGIAVFGSINTFGGNGTNTTYTIDNASPSLFTIDPAHKPQDDVQFFVSPPLTDDQHTLVIRNQNRGSWLWFEYLQVTSSPAEAPTATAGTRDAQPTTPPPDNSNGQGISGGAIGGIVAATAVFLALLGVMLFFVIRRRRNRHSQIRSLDLTDEDPPRVALASEMTSAFNTIMPTNQQYPFRLGAVPSTVDYERNFAPRTSYLTHSAGTTEEQQQQFEQHHVATQSATSIPSHPSQTTRSEKFQIVNASTEATEDWAPPPY